MNKPIKIKHGRIYINTNLMSKVDYLMNEGRLVGNLVKEGVIKRLTSDGYFEFKDLETAKNFIRNNYIPALKKEIGNEINYLHELQTTKNALEGFLENYKKTPRRNLLSDKACEILVESAIKHIKEKK